MSGGKKAISCANRRNKADGANDGTEPLSRRDRPVAEEHISSLDQKSSYTKPADYTHLTQRIWDWLFRDRSAAWTATFTAIMAIFSILLYKVSNSTERDGRAVQRAFVFPTGPATSNDSVGPQHIVFAYENSGTTPARRFVSDIQACVLNGLLPDDFSFPNYGGRHYKSVLGPRANGVNFLPISRDLMDAVRHRNKHLYVWGEFSYEDVFNQPHRTEFCYVWLGIAADPRGVMDVFDQCEHHNCIDDDCPDQWGQDADEKDCPPIK